MSTSLSDDNVAPFDQQKQIQYFAYSLRQLPEPYSKSDTNRLTLVHFAVNALDILGVWDNDDLQKQLRLDRNAIIEWIYSLQVSKGGFMGGNFLGDDDNNTNDNGDNNYKCGHIAMTYTALCTLRTLGDNWSRLNQDAIIQSLKKLQLSNGSFQCVEFGSEHDMRFLYCACCISHMLSNWSGIDVSKACSYIQSCRSFDGAFGLIPGQEGHGGSTFCAVASLVLMQKLDEVLSQEKRKDLIRWCTHRQVSGMQGRPNKLEDTCYSYWIGGTLRLLGHDDLLDHNALRQYVMKCQSTKMGGFSKVIGVYPDLLHSFYSLSYVSLSSRYFNNENNQDNEQSVHLKELNCTLGICMERAKLFEPVYP